MVLRWDDSCAAACQDYDLAVAWQDPAHAMVTWQPPAGVTRYRLESALEPTFSFGRRALESPAGPVVPLVVGTPDCDGGVFYYGVAACSEQACSEWSPVLAVGRRR